MTEKREAAEESESLSNIILHRLILVIPFLLLSSVIAFLLFTYLYEKFGSNFLTASILGIIIMCGIAFLISTTLGCICNDRLFWDSLAFLIPITVSMEAMILFEQRDVIFLTFFFGMFGGVFTFRAVDYMLLPPVDVKGIKEDKVVCIRVFSPIVDVERLIDDVLSYLKFSRHSKTPTSDNKERQWEFGIIPDHYYLSARSHDDNSVDLAFLFFTEESNELYQSKQNEKDLKFVKETVESHLRLHKHNIECKSIQNHSFSSDILEKAVKKYKSASHIEKLKDSEKMLINNLKSYKYVIIIVFSIAFMVYLWRQSISQLYEQYPPLFLAMISIISVLLGVFAKDILQFLKIGNKK